MSRETIDLLVEGGKAAPDVSSGLKLSALKANTQEIFKQINEKTKEYAGMQVPVKVVINTETKDFEIKVGIPPVSSLIKKELGIEKAAVAKPEATSTTPATAEKPVEEKPKPKPEEKIVLGDLKFEQVVKIARMKMSDLLTEDLKKAVKLVLGTANSMTGILVEGKRPKEIIKDVDEGKYDQLIE